MEPAWLRAAYEELRRGVHEIAGPTHAQRILDYHQATSLKATADEVPWCAAFVGWCLERVGVDPSGSAAARSYLDWGVGVSTIHPPTGAVVVLKRGGANQPGPEVRDAQGHVGFLWCLADPGRIVLLGGNQSDAVSLGHYPVDRVLAVRWPAAGR